MEVIYLSEALAGLKTIPKVDASRLMKALAQVAEKHPDRMSYVTELVSEPFTWRVRKGVYRAIYTLIDDKITVTRVGHKKEIY